MIGFGLYLSWQTILMNPSLMPQPNPDYHIGAVFYVQESLFLLLLVGTAVWTIRRKGFSHRRLALWVSAAVLFVGTCMQYGFAHMEETNAAVAHIGYLASCMRFVPVVLWGEMICTIPPKDSLFCIAGGYALSFAANLPPGPGRLHVPCPPSSGLGFGIQLSCPMAVPAINTRLFAHCPGKAALELLRGHRAFRIRDEAAFRFFGGQGKRT